MKLLHLYWPSQSFGCLGFSVTCEWNAKHTDYVVLPACLCRVLQRVHAYLHWNALLPVCKDQLMHAVVMVVAWRPVALIILMPTVGCTNLMQPHQDQGSTHVPWKATHMMPLISLWVLACE